MKTIKTIITAAICFVGAAAHAASLTLIPGAPEVQAGDIFSIELHMDATDAPGLQPGVFSGLVALRFDSTYVDFTGFSFAAPASELQAVSVNADGADDIVTFGFQGADRVGDIGTYSFAVNDSPDPLAAIGTIFSFAVYDANDFFDSFANEGGPMGGNQTFPIDPGNTSVSVVPLPAPLVLMLTALATLIPAVRRRTQH